MMMVTNARISDEAGANVPVQEYARQKPVVPQVNDPVGVAITKLQGLKRELDDKQRGITAYYSEDNGFRSVSRIREARTGSPTAPNQTGKGNADAGQKPSGASIVNRLFTPKG
jgi:hypothetical protein